MQAFLLSFLDWLMAPCPSAINRPLSALPAHAQAALRSIVDGYIGTGQQTSSELSRYAALVVCAHGVRHNASTGAERGTTTASVNETASPHIQHGSPARKRLRLDDGSAAPGPAPSTTSSDRSSALSMHTAVGPVRGKTREEDTAEMAPPAADAAQQAATEAAAVSDSADGVVHELCLLLPHIEHIEEETLDWGQLMAHISSLASGGAATPGSTALAAALRNVSDQGCLLLVRRLAAPATAASACLKLFAALLLPRLRGLEGNIGQGLAATLALAAEVHPRALMDGALAPLLASHSSLGAHQGQALTRFLKAAAAMPAGQALRHEALRAMLGPSAAGNSIDAGLSDGCMGVLSELLSNEQMASDDMARLLALLQRASAAPSMVKSASFMKLLMSVLGHHSAALSRPQAAALRTIALSSHCFLKKAVLAQLSRLFPNM